MKINEKIVLIFNNEELCERLEKEAAYQKAKNFKL